MIFEDRWLLDESDPSRPSKPVATPDEDRHPRPRPRHGQLPQRCLHLPKGRLYIENSPSGFTAQARHARVYQWEYLLRYGLTDNLEFRIFSNGFTAQARQGKQPATTGYSPLAFDFKANFWEENTKYHIPAMGVELYLQTTFGSPAFNGGTQPSMSLLFDQSLPLGIGFEYNLGITGVQNGQGKSSINSVFSGRFSAGRQGL